MASKYVEVKHGTFSLHECTKAGHGSCSLLFTWASHVHERSELNVAGVEGIGPSSLVLETKGLPLTDTPMGVILLQSGTMDFSKFTLGFDKARGGSYGGEGMSRVNVESYLASLNGNTGEVDVLMRQILSEQNGWQKAIGWTRIGLTRCGKSGLPGVDRDGKEVSLVAKKIHGKMSVVLIRPDGTEHELNDGLAWAAAMNRAWESRG